jgi:acetyl-CoA synthetase
VVASLPEGMPPALAEELSRAGIAPLIGIDDALTAFAAAAAIHEAHDRALPGLPEPVAGSTVATTAEMLTEREAKQRLQGFGLAVPQSIECTIAEAPQVAERLGFPVALKIAGTAVAHKSDVGGVVLSLRSASEVAQAAARLSALGDRVLVEQMIEGAVVELIVGVVRDPGFGLALLVGAGGVLAEAMSDSVTLLLPASRAEIERALRRLKVWRLIEGYRGRRGDPAAVVRAIEAIVAFAAAHREQLEELDVNPLLVLPDRAVAVDALIRLRQP